MVAGVKEGIPTDLTVGCTLSLEISGLFNMHRLMGQSLIKAKKKRPCGRFSFFVELTGAEREPFVAVGSPEPASQCPPAG